MRDFSKLNLGFHQKQANLACAGAYYTSTGECEKLAKFFGFEDNKEYVVMDPAIGNGEALFTVTGKINGRDNIKAFGVDVNHATIEQVKEEKTLAGVICADYIEGTKITGSRFSFIFDNPPYIEEMNTIPQFIHKDFLSLKTGGAYCLVIPYNSFIKHMKLIYGKFAIKHVFRFVDEEYEKWHQVAILGTKRVTGYKKEEFEAFAERYKDREDEIPLIPIDYDGEKILVPEASESEITLFTSKEFDVESALKALMVHDGVAGMGDKLMTVPYYSLADCGNPPQPPKKDHLFTLTVVGVGQGGAGRVEDNDYHLQRGVCRPEEVSSLKAADKGTQIAREGGCIEVVRHQTKTTMIVFEQSGKFTELA